jgi:chromosome segregation ATPase
MTTANSEISAENSRLWDEVQKFMAQVEVVGDELIKSKADKAKLIEAFDELEKEKNTQKNSFDEKLKDLSSKLESTVTDFTLEISELSQSVITKDATISDLQNNLSKTLEENSNIKEHHHETANELRELKNSLQSLEKTKSELILNFGDKTDALEKENAEMIVMIQELENKLQNELKDQSNMAAIHEKLQNLTDDNSSLQEQLKNLQDALTRSKSDAEGLSVENLDLKSKVEELNTLISSYSENLEKADTELSILLEDVEVYKEKFRTSDIECSQLRSRLKSQADELAAQQEEFRRGKESSMQNLVSQNASVSSVVKSQKEILSGANLDQQLMYYLKLSETSTQSMELYRCELLKKQEELKNADMEILRLQGLLQSGNFPLTT